MFEHFTTSACPTSWLEMFACSCCFIIVFYPAHLPISGLLHQDFIACCIFWLFLCVGVLVVLGSYVDKFTDLCHKYLRNCLRPMWVVYLISVYTSVGIYFSVVSLHCFLFACTCIKTSAQRMWRSVFELRISSKNNMHVNFFSLSNFVIYFFLFGAILMISPHI